VKNPESEKIADRKCQPFAFFGVYALVARLNGA
jgi:hypothetical protein